MKKLLPICIIIVGIAFVSGCLGGDKATDTKTSRDASGVATPSQQQNAGQETTVFTNTDWQKKIETDRQNNKDYKWWIDRLTGKNKTLVSINTKEVTLSGSVQLTLTEISINRENGVIKGFVENQGEKSVGSADIIFYLINEDYTTLINTHIKIMNSVNNADIVRISHGNLQIEPKQKMSFETAPIDVNTVPPQNRVKSLELLKIAPFLAVEYKG